MVAHLNKKLYTDEYFSDKVQKNKTVPVLRRAACFNVQSNQ